MQSALMNPQQYATPLAAQPAYDYRFPAMAQVGLPATAYHPGMTQLPNVPQPPYLRPASLSVPQASTGGSLSPLPDLPTPDQLLRGNPAMGTTTYVIPGVFGNGAANPANTLPTPCQAVPSMCAEQQPPYRTAASFPVNMLDPSAEVPSPYMVAPWLYLAKPQTPQVPAYPQNFQPQAQPQMPMQQPPVQQAQPKMPPQPPQQQPPAQPPQQPQPPQTPPQQPQTKDPTVDLPEGTLSDSVIRSLNDRLKGDDDTRADAAMELFKILDKDPGLSTRKPSAPYVNAFIEKILKDPNAVVRAPAELALQTGRVQQPSEGILNQLRQLDNNPGGLSGEGGIVSGLLNAIQNNTLGSGYDRNPGAMTTAGGAAEEARNKGAQNGQNPAAGGAPQQGGPMPQATPGNPQGTPVQPNPTQGNPQMAPAQGQQFPDPMSAQGAGPQTSQGPMPGGSDPQGGAQATFQNYGQPQGMPIAPQNGMPQASAYGQPPAGPQNLMQAYGGQFPTGGANPMAQALPQGMGQSGQAPQFFGSPNGSRLNYLSQAQPNFGQPAVNPYTGQRLNIQEGYRS